MNRARALALPVVLIALMPVLAGCQLRPLYANGERGPAGQILSQIQLTAIAGKSGWLVRDALSKRIGAVEKADHRYRLQVELDDQITGFGVRRDDAVTRERRTLRARYQLIDSTTNTTVIDATAGSDAGIDVVSSEYATVAAENSALERLSEIVADQIIARIAQYAEGQNKAGATQP